MHENDTTLSSPCIEVEFDGLEYIRSDWPRRQRRRWRGEEKAEKERGKRRPAALNAPSTSILSKADGTRANGVRPNNTAPTRVNAPPAFPPNPPAVLPIPRGRWCVPLSFVLSSHSSSSLHFVFTSPTSALLRFAPRPTFPYPPPRYWCRTTV